MAVSAVIEIEEGHLACTLATITRRSIAVSAHMQMPMPECTAANLTNALGALQAQLGPIEDVHVLLGDRRVCHFQTKVPELEARELVAFVQRESLRQAGLPPSTEVAGHARLYGRTDAGLRHMGVIAAPKGLIDPIVRGCADAGVRLSSVLSVESAIAGALPRSLPERVAVVDYAGGKVRFLVYEHRLLSHMRRFLVHGLVSEAGRQELLLGQLTMEIPRTLDFLRDQGCEPPQVLVVSPHVAAGDELLTATEGAMTTLYPLQPTVRLADGEALPSLATLGLLRRLQEGRPLPTLLDGLQVQQPRRPVRIMLRAASVLAAIGGTILGSAQQLQTEALESEHQRLVQQRGTLERRLAEHASPAPLVETGDRERERELAILSTRRPVSAAIARITEQVHEYLQLTSIQFLDADRLHVTGIAVAPDRLAALRAVSEFGEAVATVSFLVRSGVEDVREEASRVGCVHFRFEFAWRRP